MQFVLHPLFVLLCFKISKETNKIQELIIFSLAGDGSHRLPVAHQHKHHLAVSTDHPSSLLSRIHFTAHWNPSLDLPFCWEVGIYRLSSSKSPSEMHTDLLKVRRGGDFPELIRLFPAFLHPEHLYSFLNLNRLFKSQAEKHKD